MLQYNSNRCSHSDSVSFENSILGFPKIGVCINIEQTEIYLSGGVCMSLNRFSISDNLITIYQKGWSKLATATLRNDYKDEIQSVTWSEKGGYLYNGKLGSLHSYIIKKWYGEDIHRSMIDSGFIVEHMDNNKFNCQIENLCFLNRGENVAKGQTLDKYSKDKRYIALNLFKDFYTQLYHISVFFNYPAVLNCDETDEAVIDLAYLLYDEDYEFVINDARHILLEYNKHKTFSPQKLSFVDYHIEGAYGKPTPFAVYDEYVNGSHGHTVFYIEKSSMIENWTLENKQNFFHLRGTSASERK